MAGLPEFRKWVQLEAEKADHQDQIDRIDEEIKRLIWGLCEDYNFVKTELEKQSSRLIRSDPRGANTPLENPGFLQLHLP
jgi:hypothetical protein